MVMLAIIHLQTLTVSNKCKRNLKAMKRICIISFNSSDMQNVTKL